MIWKIVPKPGPFAAVVGVRPKSNPVAGAKVNEPRGLAPSIALHLSGVGPTPKEYSRVSVPVGIASGTALMALAVGAIVSDSVAIKIASEPKINARSNRIRENIFLPLYRPCQQSVGVHCKRAE